MYVSLLYNSSLNNVWIPLTNANLYQYVSELTLSNNPPLYIEAGYYNEIKLFIENELFDDIQFDNINSLNMLLRKIKEQFPCNVHSGIKSLLCNNTIPFKFDNVKKDREFYEGGQTAGIELSNKILPLRIELNTFAGVAYPANSFIKCIVVVLRSFKFHNGQFYYV